MSDEMENGLAQGQYTAGGLVGAQTATLAEQLAKQQAEIVPTARPAKRKSAPAKRANGAASPAPVADPNSRTLTITLPREVAEWYERQAAQAPFEPSVQRFIAWELRQRAQASQAAQAAIETEANLPPGVYYNGAKID